MRVSYFVISIPAHLTSSDIRSFQNTSGTFAEYHFDYSFEINSPSYTMLRMVKAPEYGNQFRFSVLPQGRARLPCI